MNLEWNQRADFDLRRKCMIKFKECLLHGKQFRRNAAVNTMTNYDEMVR
jgi:hypothetical protein